LFITNTEIVVNPLCCIVITVCHHKLAPNDGLAVCNVYVDRKLWEPLLQYQPVQQKITAVSWRYYLQLRCI